MKTDEKTLLEIMVKIIPMLNEQERSYLLGYGTAIIETRKQYTKPTKA